MTKKIISESRNNMEKALAYLSSELKTIRTGRANTSLLEKIKVEAYGSLMPLNGVGTISVVDSNMLSVQPWDVSLIPVIEKAILAGAIGLNPSNDGKLVRIPVPPLTEERRREFVKAVKKMGEDSKVVIRNERRDANDRIKKIEKDKSSAISLSEDEAKRLVDEVQKLTDKFIKDIDSMVASKEKELMSM